VRRRPVSMMRPAAGKLRAHSPAAESAPPNNAEGRRARRRSCILDGGLPAAGGRESKEGQPPRTAHPRSVAPPPFPNLLRFYCSMSPAELACGVGRHSLRCRRLFCNVPVCVFLCFMKRFEMFRLVLSDVARSDLRCFIWCYSMLHEVI
jgi:hypothetical protein